MKELQLTDEVAVIPDKDIYLIYIDDIPYYVHTLSIAKDIAKNIADKAASEIKNDRTEVRVDVSDDHVTILTKSLGYVYNGGWKIECIITISRIQSIGYHHKSAPSAPPLPLPKILLDELKDKIDSRR